MLNAHSNVVSVCICVRPFETVLFSILMRRKNFWNACNLKHTLSLPASVFHCLVSSLWSLNVDELRGIISRMNWIGSTTKYRRIGRRSKITGVFSAPSFLPSHTLEIHFSTLNPVWLNQCNKLTTTSYFTSPNNHLYCFSIYSFSIQFHKYWKFVITFVTIVLYLHNEMVAKRFFSAFSLTSMNQSLDDVHSCSSKRNLHYYSKFSNAMRHTLSGTHTNILIQIDGELTNACSIALFSTHINVINLRQRNENISKNGSNYIYHRLVIPCTVACIDNIPNRRLNKEIPLCENSLSSIWCWHCCCCCCFFSSSLHPKQ